MAKSRRIYLDNAATSWPKPEAVYAAVDRYQRELGAPAGRSVYRQAAEVERLVLDTRRQVAELIGAEDPSRVVFTCNGTDALNLALHGLLRPGDHVVTTVAEHNSVLRPLRYLEDQRRVSVTRVRCNATGWVDVDDIRDAITPRTRLIAMVHASNVTGALQPVEDVGRLARERGLLYLVDAAQSVGHVPVNVRWIGASVLATSGHKGLLGPLGSGLLYIAPGVEQQLEPLRQGGTGSQSLDDRQPRMLPDKYESGNLNVPAIVGLGAGIAYLRKRGLDEVRRHAMQLTQLLVDGLRGIAGVTVYGPLKAEQRVGVVTVTINGYEPQVLAAMLDASYGVQTRAGAHCAPLMHAALGTLNLGGAVRFSLGAFSTEAEIMLAIRAVAEIAATAGKQA
ncbi:MAG: aminotransferase class V-fold PLP-dependent enzyme [Planctomycetota bacterium]|nr:aminotransferase class V-fold PLP-dependent enzyme [Planctomycetota bacterium]